jgi:ADP-ribose pyrophosphatase YjhB (NUDIX family)
MKDKGQTREGREYPTRPIPGVGVVVCKDDHVLLIQRGQPPRQGEWGIPGGVLELGETWYAAAVREVREECGIEIALGKIVDAVDMIVRDGDERVQYHYAIVDFVAEYLGGDLRAASDVLDARWVSPDELPKYALPLMTRQVIRKAIQNQGE